MSHSAPTPAWDVTSFGETMACFVPERAGDRYERTHAGAESNVAAGLALLGHRARWVSRLGDDGLGRYVAGAIRRAGVTPLVRVDPERNTGLMIKEVAAGGTTVRYYRRDSAASRLDGSELPTVEDTRWLHLTGVTPALSESCCQAVFSLVERARGAGVPVSFDVNLRPRLWPDAGRCRRVLLDLCRRCELLFVGDDEAEALAGAGSATAFARALPLGDRQQLLYKRGAHGAEYLDSRRSLSEPATRVEVVDLTGAGDAFAAGYLAGLVRGASIRARLRLGQLLAARTVQVAGDVAAAPPADEVRRALADDDGEAR